MKSVREAKVTRTKRGKVPRGDGWYVLNCNEAAWWKNAKFGRFCDLKGKAKFESYGLNIHVLNPGQPSCHYHGEENQEDFLVLSGQCLLIVEGKVKKLKAWDLVHCPKWAKHVFVGAGKKPCVILMIGCNDGKGIIYPVEKAAVKYNAAAPKRTTRPKESYADCPKWVPSRGMKLR